MRIAVTGATGFVGRAVCRWLAARRASVVALSRSESSIPGATVTHRILDLHDDRGLQQAFRGADAVVHLAARAHVMSEREPDPLAAFRRVNVDGTGCVIEQARRAGVRRLVFVSTVKVLGEGKPTPYVDADVPAPRDPYAVSKLEAEYLVAASDLDWVTLRPPLIYGPGVAGNFARFLGLADLSRRVPLPLGRIANRRSLLYVDNLASVIEALLALRGLSRTSYLVADTETPSTSELLSRTAQALGGRARLLPAPVSAMRVAAFALGYRGFAERLLGSLTIDSSRIRQVLGWSPPTGIDEGLAATAAWWHRSRHAPQKA